MGRSAQVADPWEVVEMCVRYLEGLHLPDVLYQRWDSIGDVRHVQRGLAARRAGVLDSVLDPSVVVSVLETQLRDLHSREYLVFSPFLYNELLDLGRAVGRSDHETLVWVRALYARTTEPYRSRMHMILGFLATQCDVTDMDKTLYIVERYAPMLLRDGSSAYMSLHHIEGFPAATECLLLFLTYLDVLDGGLSSAALDQHLDILLHETVHTSLFASPPPRASMTVDMAATRIQAAARGWQCRRWIGLRLLYTSMPLAPMSSFRRYYLGMTKRVLHWSVSELVAEKRRLKTRLRAFDEAFTRAHHRVPKPKEKDAGLYEMYHFLRIVLDYQRQQDDTDPTSFHDFLQTATTSQLALARDKCQLQLLIFERHFYLCCGGKVEDEDDYGHILPRYLQYKTLTGKLAETA
ncbi:hypothetical protein SDRG_09058 [Saprolegnia diclina VS20]|uniref:Uncharacterized protein n=1 Tax=Saprolegnia diclina (strain VS20) TaxID=1156394 RepID=T0RTE7_SAPDV|nr:hypothetical protein SDRG_09058 [Saprolegnia diclina VS20]EQC33552.1 hypothetical protein SDRG_09058 [Saprolegnia diclina VS20]|eukprot:XP_008613192.1 hypothetical protein SDRG_09058 [Saprolegnia diclina VS20]